jgi:hypothetical protein
MIGVPIERFLLHLRSMVAFCQPCDVPTICCKWQLLLLSVENQGNTIALGTNESNEPVRAVNRNPTNGAVK